MYGTIARVRIKPGMESRFLDIGRRDESSGIPGFLGLFVYRADLDPSEYYMTVVFDSKESYFANANRPEQDAEYRKMLDLLESEPEWHDGEIVHSFLSAGVGSLR